MATVLPLNKPRPYQAAIRDKVLEKGNTIVVMDTALGKTLAAVLILQERFHQSPNGRGLFVVPTNVLLSQQWQYLYQQLQMLPEVVVIAPGGKPRERQELYSNDRVRIVVATPESVANDLVVISWLGITDVVIDECHHAVGDDAAAIIARQVRDKPHILTIGLTASPGKKVREIVENIGARCLIIKERWDDDVAPFIFHTHRISHSFKLTPEIVALRGQLKELAIKPLDFLQKPRWPFFKPLLPAESKPAMEQLEFWVEVENEKGQSEVEGELQLPRLKTLLALNDKLDEKIERLKPLAATDQGSQNRLNFLFGAKAQLAYLFNITYAVNLLEGYGVGTFRRYLLDLMEQARLLKAHKKPRTRAAGYLGSRPLIQKLEQQCQQFIKNGIDHPKMDYLLQLWREIHQRGESVIVFSRYKHSVRQVEERLRVVGYAVEMLMGQSGGGMSRKEQVEVVERFRAADFEGLISTSAGQEGIHSRAKRVIFYDAGFNSIELIQRAGRAGRTEPGEVDILYTEGTLDEAYYWSSFYGERKMREEAHEISRELEQGTSPGPLFPNKITPAPF